MNAHIPLLYLVALLPASAAVAAGPVTGPVVKGYGPVFEVPADALRLRPEILYKVSMDVSATGPDNESRNRSIESAARFLNMHAGNGIEFVLVVHGPAARDLLTDAAYRTRFQAPNPNTGLLSALGEAGVTIFICGQTAAYNGYAPDDFHPAVTQALSAMTAHVRLQTEGFALIPF
jgi:intracellular sulfur oxidation DsrE/DsrF family protein